MTFNKRQREQLLALCGELHEDDGVDPKKFFKTELNRDKNNRKTQQLCKQIADTLGLVLAGDFGDERLHCLQVCSVIAAPDASQLCVTVCTDEPCSQEQTQEILTQLEIVSGRLRAEIASTISRKRVPKLLFCVTFLNDTREDLQ